MRIVAIRSNRGPSGQYRIQMPMQMLSDRGHHVTVYQAEPDCAYSPAQFAGADILLLEMWHDPGIFNLLACIPDNQRPAVIWEADDLVWAMGPERDTCLEFNKVRSKMRTVMHNTDALILSTPELAEEAKLLNSNTHVILNAIDFNLRDWRTPYNPRCPHHSVIIGWAGGVRPSRDMQVIGRALHDVLIAHPEAAFAIAADTELAYEFAEELQVPADQLYVLPLSPFETYPQLLSLFDIGIAPVEDTRFNRCKSELKLLEYGAWGIPYVASNVAPYRRFHDRSGGCGEAGGFLVQGPTGWQSALGLLVENADLRRQKGNALQATVGAFYGLSRRTLEWEALLQSLAPRMAPRELTIR